MSSDGKVLFGRDYKVVVAPAGGIFGIDVSQLRCVFKAKKSTLPHPNTCQIEIYNLAEGSRSVLESAEKLVVKLEAGYVDTGTTQIFLGEVRSAFTKAEGTDIITTITTGDSEKEIQEARLRMTIGPGMSAKSVLEAAVQQLKVGRGNIDQAGILLGTLGVYGAYGSAISGNAARAVTDLLRSVGLEWSIQDGSMQVLKINQPVAQAAVQLSGSTGLIGSPAVDFSASSKTKKGGITVKAKCLIIPELNPGRLVIMQSKFVSGGFRIEEVEYEGDTHGDPWYADLTLRAL